MTRPLSSGLARDREQAHTWQAVYGLEPLVIYGQSLAPEDANPDGMVVLKFPSLYKVRAWYGSPEYQAVIPLREKAATWRVVIV